MIQYFHPRTHVPISGIRLGEGATIRASDYYASSDGKWRRSCLEGIGLMRGCTTVWVRPNAELSIDAKILLTYLADHDFYLTRRAQWIVIPSPRWKHDERMEWAVEHSECVTELQELGYIQQTKLDEDIYELTDAGRLALQQPM